MEYKHEIKWGDPLELKPYENNPRVNDYAVKKVLASIEEFGQVLRSLVLLSLSL